MPDSRQVTPEKECFPFLVNFGSCYHVLCELQVCCVAEYLGNNSKLLSLTDYLHHFNLQSAQVSQVQRALQSTAEVSAGGGYAILELISLFLVVFFYFLLLALRFTAGKPAECPIYDWPTVMHSLKTLEMKL